jgi:hypothetical protein
MIHVTSKLHAIYTGEKPLNGIKAGASYPVIGYRVEKKQNSETKEDFDSLAWLVLSETGKPVWLFPQSCETHLAAH